MSTRKRLLVAAALLLAGLVAADLAIGALLVRDGTFRGRPLPPYGTHLSATQRRQVAERRAALENGSLPEPSPFDRHLGWTNRPTERTGTDTDGFNALGARGFREYAPQPPPGVLRIVGFGDSFMQCAQVPWEASWQAQLEALEPGWEVINLGVNGYGTDQAFLRYQREGAGLGAHVVCIGLMLENIARNVNRYKPLLHPADVTPAAKPRLLRAEGGLELVPLPFGREIEMLDAIEDGTIAALLRPHEHWADPALPDLAWRSSLVRLGVAALGKRARDPRRLWLDEQGEPRALTLEILRSFRARALEDGARAAPVLVWPPQDALRELVGGGERFWQSGLLDALDRLGVPALDLGTALAEAAGDVAAVAELYTGHHLSAEGNAVVARAVQAWIHERGITPEDGR